EMVHHPDRGAAHRRAQPAVPVVGVGRVWIAVHEDDVGLLGREVVVLEAGAQGDAVAEPAVPGRARVQAGDVAGPHVGGGPEPPVAPMPPDLPGSGEGARAVRARRPVRAAVGESAQVADPRPGGTRDQQEQGGEGEPRARAHARRIAAPGFRMSGVFQAPEVEARPCGCRIGRGPLRFLVMGSFARVLLLVTAASIPARPAPAATAPAPASGYPSAEAVARYALGRLAVERGEEGEALAEFYRVLALDPRARSTSRAVSEIAARRGDAASSLEFAERTLSLDPEDARGWWLKGSAQFNLG